MNCINYVRNIILTIFPMMRLVGDFYVVIVSISEILVWIFSVVISKSGNLNWQEAVHNEKQENLDTLSVQSNIFQSSEKTLLTSYDIDIVIKTRENVWKKSYNWVPKHKFLKNQDFKSERNIT